MCNSSAKIISINILNALEHSLDFQYLTKDFRHTFLTQQQRTALTAPFIIVAIN